MKTIINNFISPSLKTYLAYMYYDFANSSFVSPLKNFRRRKLLLKRHYNLFNDLKTQGYSVINNYLNNEQCKRAVIELKIAFENYNTFVHKKEDLRIFGIEQILPMARSLAQDKDFLELGELVNKQQTYCAFTLGNWLLSGKSGSSGNGWHRDSFFSQYKALLYLTDVTEDNGPFELLPRSHHLKNIIHGIEKVGLSYMQNRISDIEVQRLEELLKFSRKSLIGNAGTLVLFNSTLIHRGRPIKSGERLALTNYYIPYARDILDVQKQFSPVVVAADV